LPVAGFSKETLYGNGAAIVPNVHAVMAWAARKTLAGYVGINGEEPQKPTNTGEGRQFYNPRNGKTGITNVIR
jgi:hypothetical protein